MIRQFKNKGLFLSIITEKKSTMQIWSAEIKELESLYTSIKGKFPELEKDLEHLIKTDDENVALLYSRRCLEIIVTDLCERELKRPRKTEPLKGIIDKLHREEKVPSHIITSMDHLNSLSTYGTHPKEFDPEQVKPVLFNLTTIIKWYVKYKDTQIISQAKPEEAKYESKESVDTREGILKPKKRLIFLLSGLLLIVAIVVVALFVFNIIGGETQSKKIEKSIAVLPFKLLSDEPDKQYLADGMMDAILLHLSKIEDLRVMSRTSTEQYRELGKTMTEIGRELGVNYLLEGSFQKYGDNVRLIVQLIKTGKEGHEWANEYDRKWDDILSVQSEVAQTIARELHTVITPEEKELIEKAPTADLTAYDLYLKANSYLEDYNKTRNLDSYQKAVSFYMASIDIDSAFAKAYTGLAIAYWNRYYWESYFKENFMDSCLVLVNIALSFDNQLDVAYYGKGEYYYINGQIEEALENFDKALKNNPNYFSAYSRKGYILTWIIHDFVKGLDNYHKALSRISGDERSNLLWNLGRAYLDIGFIEKARYYYKEALALSGDSVSYFGNLAWLECSIENFEDAKLLYEKLTEIDSTLDLLEYYSFEWQDQEAYIAAKKQVEQLKKTGALPLQSSHRIGYAFWKVGKYKEAEYYFNEQIKYGTESIKLSRDIASKKAAQYDLAGVYAFLGNKAKAYQYLDEFNTMNFYPTWWISLAKYDPLFDSIRNEERFQKILQNMEAKYQAEHERVRKWMEEQGEI
jgi:TolB-like protein/Tfp pilus assembly protein PilF